jgi:hypothetical protein
VHEFLNMSNMYCWKSNKYYDIEHIKAVASIDLCMEMYELWIAAICQKYRSDQRLQSLLMWSLLLWDDVGFFRSQWMNTASGKYCAFTCCAYEAFVWVSFYFNVCNKVRFSEWVKHLCGFLYSNFCRKVRFSEWVKENTLFFSLPFFLIFLSFLFFRKLWWSLIYFTYRLCHHQCSVTRTRTHTLSLSLTHTHAHTWHTHIQTPHTHTHTHTHKHLSLSYTYTHTHTHTVYIP